MIYNAYYTVFLFGRPNVCGGPFNAHCCKGWKLHPTLLKCFLRKYLYTTMYRPTAVGLLQLYTSQYASYVLKGTDGHQKTYEIFHVYCIFYSGFRYQTTVIFGITKDGSLVLNT